MTPARHGTPSGYRAHQRRGERPCDACVRAKSDYDKRRLSATPLQARNRAHAKAQSLALVELKRMHPTEYAALYAMHKRALGIEAQP